LPLGDRAIAGVADEIFLRVALLEEAGAYVERLRGDL
jgi:hypothetical protein